MLSLLTFALCTWGVLQVDYAFCPLPIVNTYSQSISILFAVRTIGQFWQFGIIGIREVRAKISIGDSVGLGVVRVPTVVSTALESGGDICCSAAFLPGMCWAPIGRGVA